VTTPAPGDADGADGGLVPYTAFEADLTGGPDLYVGEAAIPGWRANNVVVDASRRRAWLVGVHHQRRYGVHATAVCDVEDHAAPASGCHCGLHAWPDREGAEGYRRQWGQHALCRVELEGEVICHGDPGTEDIEGYRASNMTTLGVEFVDRCWRCGRTAVALSAVQDGQNRMRVAYGQPDGLADLRPVCERCRRFDSLTCADVASLLRTEVCFAPAQPVGTGRWARVQDSVSRGPTAFMLSAALLLAVAVFGMIGALVEGSWVTGVLFGVTTVAALGGGLLLATGRGGRRLGVAIAVLTVAFLVIGPLVATINQTTDVGRSRAEGVLTALEGPVPADIDDLADRLSDAGASSVRVAEIDPDHRAVSFVAEGHCYQTGLATESTIDTSGTDPVTGAGAASDDEGSAAATPDGAADPSTVEATTATTEQAWLAIGTQSTGIAVGGECPPAYPVLGAQGLATTASR